VARIFRTVEGAIPRLVLSKNSFLFRKASSPFPNRFLQQPRAFSLLALVPPPSLHLNVDRPRAFRFRRAANPARRSRAMSVLNSPPFIPALSFLTAYGVPLAAAPYSPAPALLTDPPKEFCTLLCAFFGTGSLRPGRRLRRSPSRSDHTLSLSSPAADRFRASPHFFPMSGEVELLSLAPDIFRGPKRSFSDPPGFSDQALCSG